MSAMTVYVNWETEDIITADEFFDMYEKEKQDYLEDSQVLGDFIADEGYTIEDLKDRCAQETFFEHFEDYIENRLQEHFCDEGWSERQVG